MIDGFARIDIAVPDLANAVDEYHRLVGSLSVGAGDGDGTAALALANVGLRLVEDRAAESPTLAGLALWSRSGTALPADCRGLPLSVTANRSVSGEPTATGLRGVDHIVVRSGDADDCIRLFRDDLGMRLALDQDVPEWGGRMLFFRCGKLTLEVIQHREQPAARDHLWGITYLCDELDRTLALLDENAVAHSPARDGRKPGTRVATVKSHQLGIPTLLIQPAPAGSR
jgi:catechol 2,3-dioxygenase-like lactoylglutathione lyase family enzyme